MATSNVQGPRAAAAGRFAKEAYVSSGAVPDMEFTDDDTAALKENWSWLLEVVGAVEAAGPGGLIDDEAGSATQFRRPQALDEQRNG